MTNPDHYHRQAAVEDTVARLNAERAANGLVPDYIVTHSRSGVASLGIAAPAAATERVRLSPAPTPKTKRERL